jgi:hypothetical protein
VAGSASYDLTEWMTAFTETIYFSRAERPGRDSVLFDVEVIWRPARDVALDASVITSLAGSGPDWALRGGVSLRFGG